MTLAPIRQLDLTIHGKEASVSEGLIAEAAITAAKIAEGSIDNAKIAANALIAYSKLSLAGTILNSDINENAAIVYEKLNLTGKIVDGDIKSDADIGWGKISKTNSSLADLATRSAGDLSSGTLDDQRLSSNVPLKDAATNAFTQNMTIGGTLDVTGALGGSSITLSGNLGAVDGNFSGNLAAVDAVLSGNLNAVAGTFSGNVSAVDAILSGNATISGDVSAVNATFSGALEADTASIINNASVGGNLTVTGNLVVNGSTTTVTSTEVTVADRIIHLNHSDAEDAPPPSALAGFQVDRGNNGLTERAAAALTWDEISSTWQFSLLTGESTVGTLQDVKMKDLDAAAVSAVSAVLSGDLDAVNANLSGNLNAVDAILSGDLSAVGATLSGNLGAVDAVLSGNLSAVGGDFSGAVQVGSTLGVTGAVTLDSTLALGGNLSIATDKFTVAAASGNTVIAGTLDVDGAVDFDGALDVAGAVVLRSTVNAIGAVDFDSTLNVDGAVTMMSSANVAGNFSVATDKFTVAAASGNTIIVGTLDVDGAVDLDGALDVAGAVILRNTVNAIGAVDFDSTLNVDGNVSMGADLTVVGNVVAASFAGDGSLLTALNANEITSGELNDARLSANVMLLDANQTVTGVKTFTSSLTSVMAAASDVSLKARVTGDTQDRVVLRADGQILIGSGSAAADVNLYRDAANVLKTDDKLVVGGEFNAIGNADLDGTLNVDGAVTLMSTANVAGNFSVGTDKFTVAAASGNTLIAGTLEVDGNAQLDGNLALAGDLAIGTNKFTVTAASGNFTAAGNGTVSGNLTVGGNLSVNGTVTYINSTNTAVSDKIIQLNRPETMGENVDVPSGYAGLSIHRGTVSNVAIESAAMVWEEALSRFKMGSLSVDEITLTPGDLEVDGLIAQSLSGDGANITGLMANQVGIQAIGGITGSDVQAALEEIQTNISSIVGGGGGGSASLQSLSDATSNIIDGLGFDAQGVLDPFAGTTFIDDMTVRAALVKLDQEVNDAQVDLGTHIGDTADAHDASAISVVPTGNLLADDVQEALQELQGDIDTINAKTWRQALIYSATGGETSLNKPTGAPNIPADANTQVFIDGRKVFMGADRQFTVAAGGGSISFAALDAGQSVELLYWA